MVDGQSEAGGIFSPSGGLGRRCPNWPDDETMSDLVGDLLVWRDDDRLDACELADV